MLRSKHLMLIIMLPMLLLSNLQGIELKRVILATNNNPTYIQFWPIVAPLWKQMGLTPTLALIADDDCEIDCSLGDVIRFKPIPGVPESLQAQTVRVLLPALFPEDGCLISDIDMLPISRSYFFEGAEPCPEDSFLIYRDKAYPAYEPKYPMCYFGGKGQLFQEIFGVQSADEINTLIINWNTFGYGWCTDEVMLYRYVTTWEQAEGKGRVFRLGHGVGPRLDRLWWDIENLVDKISRFIDCHCPRPYSANKESIDKVVEAIYRFWSSCEALETGN